MVKHSNVTCMLAEASALNWVFGGPGFTPVNSVVNGESMWLTGLAGRHGKVYKNHGMAHIGFFDGHVTLFDTKPIANYVNGSGQGGATEIPQSLGVVFTLMNSR